MFPDRQSVRMPGYDYGRVGSYFVTICAFERRCQFGSIRDGTMVANPIGEVIQEEWARSAAIRTEIALDAFVLMPNHLHGVIRIRSRAAPGSRGRGSRRARTVSSFVAGFKAAVTSRTNRARWLGNEPVWQRGFFEHVIRDERELALIRRYIRANPVMWQRDAEFR